MTYEIWSVAGRNLIQTFESEDQAWGSLRALAHKHGEKYIGRLALTREDEDGKTVTLGVGPDLIKHLRTPA